jgi:hypothetical protein
LFAAIQRFLNPSRSVEPADFSAFLQRQGAFVAQKTVIDYCRVKTGRSERHFFSEADFNAALRHCRWQVYLGTMADVTALAEAWLRPHVADRPSLLADRLADLHHAILRAESPPEEEADSVAAALAALPSYLAKLQLAAPYSAHRLPLLAREPLLATLPIHPEQRKGEEVAILGALRFHIVSTQQEMERAFEPVQLAGNLVAEQPAAARRAP